MELYLDATAHGNHAAKKDSESTMSEHNRQMIQQLEKAIEENPGSIAPRLQLSRILIRNGEKERARQVLMAAQAMEPENKYLAMQLDLLNRNGPAVRDTGYVFSTQKEQRNINRVIKLGSWIIVVTVALILMKLAIFPSTRRMVVTEENNSYPVWSMDGNPFWVLPDRRKAVDVHGGNGRYVLDRGC